MNSLASRVIESNRAREDTEDDDDAIFAELEAEIENADSAAFRERGLEQLRLQANKLKEMHQNAHGSYTEITNEKEVIRLSANEPRCIIHFYHGNFRRCEIMDKHLAKLAPKYFATRFIRVFVENVPWLVERLSVQVLPCVICFVDGVSKDRLIGFEELGNSDVFETAVLELRLSQSGEFVLLAVDLIFILIDHLEIGVLQKAENSFNLTYSAGHRRTIRDNLRKGNEDDEDFDLED
ncbi:thioredoxin-like protein [Imleria badia]|nr:thioredoxin-like protein [Imleria badia]